MPIFNYVCIHCGKVFDVLIMKSTSDPLIKKCPHCGEYAPLDNKVPGSPSFKIKGMRAANGYGLKSIDTYGVDQVTGKESGYSFTSNKAQTSDHNLGEDK